MLLNQHGFTCRLPVAGARARTSIQYIFRRWCGSFVCWQVALPVKARQRQPDIQQVRRALSFEVTALQRALSWLWQSLVVSGLQTSLSAQHVLFCGGWSTVRVWCVAVLLLLLMRPCAAPGILNKGICACPRAGFIVFRTRVAMYQCRLVRHSFAFKPRTSAMPVRVPACA